MSKVLQQKCHRITFASNLIFTKKCNFEPLHKERDVRKCNSARFQTKTADARYENLIVEDLEGSIETPFTRKIPRSNRPQQTAELVKEARDLYYHILEDVLAGRDLNVYQGADFQDFFRDTEPKRVSEVCLVNDHFMLVKMPETCWRRSSQIDSIAEEEVSNEDSLKLVEISEETTELGKSKTNKASKYFHCNRSSKVSPIHDQLDQTECGAGRDVTNVLCNEVKSRPIGSSWLRKSNEVEVHKTITKISGSKIGTLNSDKERHNETEDFKTITKISGKPKKSSDIRVLGKSEKQHQQSTLNLDNSKINLDQALGDDLSQLEAPTFLEEYVRNPRQSLIYNSSLHDRVSLEHNGTLITPRRKKPSNGKNCETEHTVGMMEKRKQAKKLPRFNAFRWLLKPFRLRNQRAPKAKIHAVINKTYFVRWKRPPDDHINGFGVKSEIVREMPILRRCRSATF